MSLTLTEIDALRATIGKRAAKILCPPPSIFRSHIETSSYTIWLEEKPYFINIFEVGEDENDLRIAVERSETPLDITYFQDPAAPQGVVQDCGDIYIDAKDPCTIRQIGVYEWKGKDRCLIFGFDDGDRFALSAGDVLGELAYYWPGEFGWIKDNCTLRFIIDSSDQPHPFQKWSNKMTPK